MIFLARLVSGSLENWSFAHRSPRPPLRKNFLHGVQVLVRGYLCVRFDVPSSINFRDISGFPKFGARNPYYGSHQRVLISTIGFYEYHFLLVINCTRGCILHCFRDLDFDMSIVAMFGYFSCVLSPMEGFPWDDHRKILHDGQWTGKLQNGVEILSKILAG